MILVDPSFIFVVNEALTTTPRVFMVKKDMTLLISVDTTALLHAYYSGKGSYSKPFLSKIAFRNLYFLSIGFDEK